MQGRTGDRQEPFQPNLCLCLSELRRLAAMARGVFFVDDQQSQAGDLHYRIATTCNPKS
ncbi:MAG: hypothetical protein ACRCY0_09340 [Synechococcus elongatus]|uniref:hypothetical protein n=1 Tax=Synechococcus elongatus TaxID=32046 RepID=UPI000305AD59